MTSILPPPPIPEETWEYLTKADILAAVEALKAAGAYQEVYVVPPEMAAIVQEVVSLGGTIPVKNVIGATFATGDSNPWQVGDMVTDNSTGEMWSVIKVESPPRQEPLFTLPPPATPCGWSIEWRWREGECDWTTGKQKDQSWSAHSTHRCSIRLKRALRRARYTDHSRRREFRVRVTLFDYHGDIVYNGPGDPPKPDDTPF